MFVLILTEWYANICCVWNIQQYCIACPIITHVGTKKWWSCCDRLEPTSPEKSWRKQGPNCAGETHNKQVSEQWHTCTVRGFSFARPCTLRPILHSWQRFNQLPHSYTNCRNAPRQHSFGSALHLRCRQVVIYLPETLGKYFQTRFQLTVSETRLLWGTMSVACVTLQEKPKHQRVMQTNIIDSFTLICCPLSGTCLHATCPSTGVRLIVLIVLILGNSPVL